MSKNRNKLYNYIVNTYGLSREKIMEHIDARIDDLISKVIGMKLHSNSVERVIANEVANVIGKGFKRNDYDTVTIQEYIKREIASQIEDKMNNDYELEVKITRKSKMVVGTANSKTTPDLKELINENKSNN